MFGKITRRPADIIYSQYRRGIIGKCQRCGSTKSLQISHFYGRANEATRFLDDNCDIFCAGCHQYFTANPLEYVEYKKKQLGDQRFKLLQVAAHTYQKRDDEKVLLYLSKVMNEKPPTKNKQCPAHKMIGCVICSQPVVRRVKVKIKKKSGIDVS